MTSSPPSVESADGLEAAVERCFKENRLGDIISLIAADRKAERAVRAELAEELRDCFFWGTAGAYGSDGKLEWSEKLVPTQVRGANEGRRLNQIIQKLEAGPQPKQEREA